MGNALGSCTCLQVRPDDVFSPLGELPLPWPAPRDAAARGKRDPIP